MNGVMSRAAVLVFGAAAAGAQDISAGGTAPVPAATAAQRFAEAVSFDQFVQGDTTRRAEWLSTFQQAGTPVDEVSPRLRGLTGRWRLLIIAESWCNDAVNSVPYLARLAAAHPAIELRLLRKADAPELLDAHRLDGRTATPLVLLYDSAFAEHGVWIERPEPLRRLIRSKEGRVCEDTLNAAVRAWRAADGGRTVLAEVVGLIERAALGPTASTHDH